MPLNSLTPKQQEEVLKNINLAKFWASKFRGRYREIHGAEIDDLLQEARVGLIVAIIKTKNIYTRLSRVAYWCWWMRQRIRRFIQSNYSMPHHTNFKADEKLRWSVDSQDMLAASRELGEFHEIEYFNGFAAEYEDPLDRLIKKEEKEIVYKVVASLKKENWKIVARERILRGKPLAEVGKILGCSRQNVEIMEKRVLKKLSEGSRGGTVP